jgi:hypothetical protein
MAHLLANFKLDAYGEHTKLVVVETTRVCCPFRGAPPVRHSPAR